MESSMTHALKAALWSGLVFPGLGQFVLKRKRRAVAFISVFAAGLALVIAQAYRKAVGILEGIQTAGGGLPLEAVSKAAQAPASSDGGGMRLIYWALAACWIFAIIDAYRIGREIDREGPPSIR